MNRERALRNALLDAIDEPAAITKSRLLNILVKHPESDTAGYIIADKATGLLDWDGAMHPTIEACIESMCGPYQQHSRESGEPGKDYWGGTYEILQVRAGGHEHMSREAAAKALRIHGFPSDEFDCCAAEAIKAADAHDLAHRTHRITIDDGTVERAAKAAAGLDPHENWPVRYTVPDGFEGRSTPALDPEPFRRHQYRFTYDEACEWAEKLRNATVINGRTYEQVKQWRPAKEARQ